MIHTPRIGRLHGRRRIRYTVFLALAGTTMTSPVGAQDLEFRVRQGFDNNVLQVGGPTTEPTKGQFTELGFSYRSPWIGEGVRLRLEPTAEAQWYPPSSTRNGLSAVLPVQIRTSLYRQRGSRTRVTLDVNLTGAYDRQLFLKRSVREELLFGSLDPEVTFGELPQRVQLMGAATVDVRLNTEASIRIGAVGRLRDYQDSSDPTVPEYQQLDDHEIGATAGTTLRFGSLTLDVDAAWRRRNNPNKEARDAIGSVLPGQNRQLDYVQLLVGTDVDPGGAIDNRAHLFLRHRTDRIGGYYGYNEWEIGDRLRLRVKRGVRITLSYSIGQRVYERFSPSGSPTSNTYHDAQGEVEIRLARAVRLALGPRYDRTISNDPALDYGRARVFGEFRIRP